MIVNLPQVKKWLEEFEELDERCGDFTEKGQFYKSSYSLHVKFEKEVGIHNAIAHCQSLLNGGPILYAALKRLEELLEEE